MQMKSLLDKFESRTESDTTGIQRLQSLVTELQD